MKTGIKLKGGYERKAYQKAYNKYLWKTKAKESNKHVKEWRKKNKAKLAEINKRYYDQNQVTILIYQQLLSLVRR